MIDRRNDRGQHNDLLAKLLAARDPETGLLLDTTQVRDEVITLILAGHETTSNALSWTWYLLGTNPGAEARLHAELRSVLAGRTPTVADLPDLPYTAMVINESMRLYPPAWAISRSPTDDDEIGGYRIPRGSVVMLCQYITHRHPGFWKDPERFDPERFSPQCSENRPRFAYFPFGGGPRLCIGSYFALTEAQLILATIAQRYRLKLVTDQPVEPEPLITLRPRHGINVTLEPLARNG
jgi:cytochrome P450